MAFEMKTINRKWKTYQPSINGNILRKMIFGNPHFRIPNCVSNIIRKTVSALLSYEFRTPLLETTVEQLWQYKKIIPDQFIKEFLSRISVGAMVHSVLTLGFAQPLDWNKTPSLIFILPLKPWGICRRTLHTRLSWWIITTWKKICVYFIFAMAEVPLVPNGLRN